MVYNVPILLMNGRPISNPYVKLNRQQLCALLKVTNVYVASVEGVMFTQVNMTIEL